MSWRSVFALLRAVRVFLENQLLAIPSKNKGTQLKDVTTIVYRHMIPAPYCCGFRFQIGGDEIAHKVLDDCDLCMKVEMILMCFF